jgi:hypothetical protein
MYRTQSEKRKKKKLERDQDPLCPSCFFFPLSIASTARASAALAGEIAKQSYTKLLSSV